jgi:hypothetical protein
MSMTQNTKRAMLTTQNPNAEYYVLIFAFKYDQ